MTTQTDGVSAPDQQQQAPEVSAEEQAIAEQISQTAAEQTEQKAEEVAKQTGLSLEDVKTLLKEEFNGFTGRQNNWNAQQIKQIREELQRDMDTKLQPLSQFLGRIEQAQIEQLSPEEQVAYWKAKASQPAAPATPAPKPSELALSDQDKNALQLAVSSMLDGKGLDPNLLADAKLWDGATTQMSADQLYAVARRNADRLVQKPAATPKPAAAKPAPAASASGAPRRSSTQLRSKSEVGDLLIEGKIDSTQMRKMLRELDEKGVTSF